MTDLSLEDEIETRIDIMRDSGDEEPRSDLEIVALTDIINLSMMGDTAIERKRWQAIRRAAAAKLVKLAKRQNT